jgi:hypothetical protein
MQGIRYHYFRLLVGVHCDGTACGGREFDRYRNPRVALYRLHLIILSRNAYKKSCTTFRGTAFDFL